MSLCVLLGQESSCLPDARMLLYTMEEKEPVYADLLIKDGKIFEIASSITPTDDMEVLDATGLLVFPGFLDAHSHIGISEEKVTGIGEYAFKNCKNLIEVISYTSENVLAASNINEYAIEIHSGESKLVKIDDYVFYTYQDENYLLRYLGNDNNVVLPENYNGEAYNIYDYAFEP